MVSYENIESVGAYLCEILVNFLCDVPNECFPFILDERKIIVMEWVTRVTIFFIENKKMSNYLRDPHILLHLACELCDGFGLLLL